jgi:hypothetical protein
LIVADQRRDVARLDEDATARGEELRLALRLLSGSPAAPHAGLRTARGAFSYRTEGETTATAEARNT